MDTTELQNYRDAEEMTVREVLALCDELEEESAYSGRVDVILHKNITQAVKLLRKYAEDDYTAAFGAPVIHERREGSHD